MKSQKVKIDLLSSAAGDWQAIYVDGKRVMENHMISAGHALTHASYARGPIEFKETIVPQDIAKQGAWPYLLPEMLSRIERGGKIIR